MIEPSARRWRAAEVVGRAAFSALRRATSVDISSGGRMSVMVIARNCSTDQPYCWTAVSLTARNRRVSES